jgi:pantoate--beta-alanine ligase
MHICETISATRQAILQARQAGKKIGFVPTMGALHAGHAILMRRAKTECDCVVVSIFVNPTQFGPNEDFTRYPRTFEADQALCAAVGVDVIFYPTPELMYPKGYQTFVEVTEITKPLCGASRPGHFRGVATVVTKLFNIVMPDVAYFGQKDAQQCRVIQQMVADLNMPIQIEIVETVREPDGLAMSSRNRYLNPLQRHHATILYRTLVWVKEQIAAGQRNAHELEKQMALRIEQTPEARLDYAKILDYETFSPVETIEKKVLVALAVFFDQTRLIDNFLIDV